MDEVGAGDVYFLPEYFEVYARKGNGLPRCLVHRSDWGCVVYPFLLRSVSALAGFESVGDWWDISSPYGYGGPLYSAADPHRLAELASGFSDSLGAYCRENRIVSEFVRLHPLLENARFLPEEGKVRHHQTVYMDVRPDDEQIMKGLRKGHRSAVKKALRLGVTVDRGGEAGRLGDFYDLYTKTMERQKAAPGYYFPRGFFGDTLDLLCEHAALFTACHEGNVVSAAILLVYRDYAGYHFSGSAESGLQLCANHLLVFEAARWARGMGAKFLHLGGGLSPEDSLFMFKSGFSALRGEFYTYRRIHNAEMYDKLVSLRREAETREGSQVDERFFPRYRA